MKIAKVTIKNYRSCIDTRFAPNERLSVLIGPNGSGKTNILLAMQLLHSSNPSRSLHSTEVTSSRAPSEIVVEYRLRDGRRLIHSAKLQLVTDERNQDEVVSADERWTLVLPGGRRLRSRFPSWFAGERYPDARYLVRSRSHLAWRRVQTKMGASDELVLLAATEVVNETSYYSASQFTNPANCPISFEMEDENKRRTAIGIRGHKRFLFDLYRERRADTSAYREFTSLVGRTGVNIVQDIQFNELVTSSSQVNVLTGGKITKSKKTNLLIVPSFTVFGNRLSPSQLSEGTFKTLALIFYLVTDRNSVLMIEEPEVCVHHGLLRSIVELIRAYSKRKQILVSTHSDTVLDDLEIENVFKVRRSAKEGTTVTNAKRSLKAGELRALREYLQTEGSLGEFWKHGDLENV